MSEKLRKRLGKRGRVDKGVDDNVNTAHFHVITDVSDDYPNVEVTIRKV
jgi:broad-specificity NMP kinase